MLNPDYLKVLRKINTRLNKVSSKEVLKEFSNLLRETMGTIIKIGNIASGEKDVNNKELRQELNHKLGGTRPITQKTPF